MQLRFNAFDMETCIVPSLCTCDDVEIRDGQSESSPLLKRHCVDDLPSPLRSSGRHMWVEFESDSRSNEKGFNATFEAFGKVFFFHSMLLLFAFSFYHH